MQAPGPCPYLPGDPCSSTPAHQTQGGSLGGRSAKVRCEVLGLLMAEVLGENEGKHFSSVLRGKLELFNVSNLFSPLFKRKKQTNKKLNPNFPELSEFKLWRVSVSEK